MIPEWLSFVDVAVVFAVFLFAWGGYQKGFAGQVAYILTFSIIGGLLFLVYPRVHGFLSRVFRSVDDTVIMWVLMAGLVVLGIFVLIMLRKLLAKTLKAHISEQADHIFGTLLGLVRGTLTILLAMIFLVMLGPQTVEESFQNKSYAGSLVVDRLVPRIRTHLPRPLIGEKVRELRQKLLKQKEGGAVE